MLWVGCNGVCCYVVSSDVVGRECCGLVVNGVCCYVVSSDVVGRECYGLVVMGYVVM